MSGQRENNLQEVAGLWERTSANGREYIGGRTSEDDGDITIPAGSFMMVFPNESDNPRAPAFRLVFAPPDPNYQKNNGGERKTGQFDKFKRPGSGGGASQAAAAPAQQAAPADDGLDDEDIPF